jgi:lipopolysaccharide biosynthesis glycosyltransferase
MKMIAVTIAVGEKWKPIAQYAINQMVKMTGLQCGVIDNTSAEFSNPSWLKCRITDLFHMHDSFLYFDADIIARKPWKPDVLFEMMGRPFCAAVDKNCDYMQTECVKYNLPYPSWYVNAGLLMFGREHQYIWDYVWSKHPEYGTWYEQTALNEALLKLNVEVCRFPHSMNQIIEGSSPVARAKAVNLHAAGFRGEYQTELLNCVQRRIQNTDKNEDRYAQLLAEVVPNS